MEKEELAQIVMFMDRKKRAINNDNINFDSKVSDAVLNEISVSMYDHLILTYKVKQNIVVKNSIVIKDSTQIINLFSEFLTELHSKSLTNLAKVEVKYVYDVKKSFVCTNIYDSFSRNIFLSYMSIIKGLDYGSVTQIEGYNLVTHINQISSELDKVRFALANGNFKINRETYNYDFSEQEFVNVLDKNDRILFDNVDCKIMRTVVRNNPNIIMDEKHAFIVYITKKENFLSKVTTKFKNLIKG